jgi:hypothetical protein
MAHFLLYHMSQVKTIQTYKLDLLDYFIIIFKIFEILKDRTHGNTSFALIVHLNILTF